MQKKRIGLATPTMHTEEMGFIKEAFDKNWIAPLGFNCDGFESELAAYLNKDGNEGVGDIHALSLCSGTAALHLAVKLAGVRRGDYVFCSDMTFAATVNPVTYEGAIPVFVDSEMETWNMDPEALKKAFEVYPQAKAIVLAHLYGTPAKLDEIMSICEQHNAILIEDAAESLSATYKGRQTGTFGKYNVVSFNGNKIITSSGGGMLLTHDTESREKAFFWATQAREKAPWYQHEEIGYNYRMSNISAGIGRGQLLHLDEHHNAKKEIYKRYQEGFNELPVSMNPYLADTEPNFWLSCMLLDKHCHISAMDLYDKLNKANIEARPIWKPMHMQPVFAGNPFIYTGNAPVNEDIFAHGLCLPSDIKMTEKEQSYVIDVIAKNLI